jgi:heptaprenylglyceryl phosphate synthase
MHRLRVPRETGSPTRALSSKYWGYKIIYVDAGACYGTKTLKISTGSVVVGEIWPTIIGGGSAFADQTKPTHLLSFFKILFVGGRTCGVCTEVSAIAH